MVEILKSSSSSDLFNPDMERGTGSRKQDLVTKDLLGALLAVNIYIYFFAPEAYNGGPVSPLLGFYSTYLYLYSTHVQPLNNGHPQVA